MPNDYGQQFGTQSPNMMLRVNSSSLGPFKTCPRKWQYEIRDRYAPIGDRVHLTFGTLMHEAIHYYEQIRAGGEEHEEALKATYVRLAYTSWNHQLGRPWSSTHGEKNRLGLLRSIVWYLDHWNQGPESQYELYKFPSGQPALEIEFEVDSGYRTRRGEMVSFVGRLDRIVRAKFNNKLYIVDTKTTSFGTGAAYYQKYTPDNQFSLYPWVGQHILPEPVAGMILDQMQIGATFTRFARGVIERTKSQLDEWIRDTHWWLRQMEDCGEAAYWPQNDRSCGLYGGCEFRQVCSEEEKMRDAVLKMGFHKDNGGIREVA